MAKMSKRGQKIKSLPKAKASAMSRAKKIAGSAAKPKSRGQKMSEAVAKSSRAIASKAFSGRAMKTPADYEAMRKTESILRGRMTGERQRSATRERAAVVKGKRQDIARARKTARKAITGR